jgi:hypothetical protein
VIEDEIARLYSDLKCEVSLLRSVAKRRLMETKNLSACATLNWKVCNSAIAMYLSAIK